MQGPTAAAESGGARQIRTPAEDGLWNGVCRLFRVLWVSRVSVVSLAAGILLMWKVPQAQDMFAEYNPDWWYWPLFFLALAFGWAFPVHFASRWILGSGLRVLEPTALAYMDGVEEQRVLDLYRPFVTWVPRILGLACFGAVALGIHEAEGNLQSAAGFAPAERALGQLDWLARANLVVTLLFAAFLLFRSDLVRLVRTGRWRGDGATKIRPSWDERRWDSDLLMALAYVGVLFIAWLAAVLFPVDFVTWLYRAVVFAVMLGFPVFALTWLAYQSHVTRAPLILIFGLVCAGISALSFHAHDLRVLRAEAGAASSQQPRQLRLDQAIAAWRRHNACPVGPCPSPIIVTGQGGASRAAFFTAAVVGDLLDRSPIAGERPQFAKQLFALSTVSGSSLGAVAIRAALQDSGYGAPGRPSGPPCTRSSALWHGSHPAPEGGVEAPPRDPAARWRDCLELLVAGDYLSPSFVGLFFRDVVSVPWFGRPLWADRAAILEESWEKHYRRTVDHADSQRRGLGGPFGYHPAKAEGDTGWVPLLFLNGSTVGGGRRILAADVLPWSCPDGRTDATPHVLYSEAFDLVELLAAEGPQLAYGRSCAGAPEQSSGAPDIALSTAATTSARFPVLSPPGAIRRKSGDIVEHVIDGGYFDNEGLTTARDVAAVLRRSGLVPVILRLTNEPASAPPPPGSSSGTPTGTPVPRPTLPDGAAGSFLISFISPLTGLYNTRTGHGSEAARAAIDCVDDRTGPSEYMQVAVFPRAPRAAADPEATPPAEAFLEKISMSWWLSQPVQAYLERQMADPRNGPAFDTLMALLGRPVDGAATGCHG